MALILSMYLHNYIELKFVFSTASELLTLAASYSTCMFDSYTYIQDATVLQPQHLEDCVTCTADKFI